MARLKRVTNVFDSTVELGEEFIFLGSIADLVETEVPTGEWEVVLNGKILTKDLWEVTYPGELDVVLLQPLILGGGGGGDEKANMRTVALIGVSLASMGVGAAISGGFLAGAAAGTTLTMAQTGVMIAGMTATNIIGGMLVNKLLPMPATMKPEEFSAYKFNSVASQREGLAIPMWYGHFKLSTGNAIDVKRVSNLVTVGGNSSIVEKYDLTIAYGLGPWNRHINQAVENSKSIAFDTRLGTLGQTTFDTPFDPTQVTLVTNFTFPGTDSAKTTGTVVEFDPTVENINKLEWNMVFPNGLYYTANGSGSTYAQTVTIGVLVAKVSSWNGSTYAWQSCYPIVGGDDRVSTSSYPHDTATQHWSYGRYITKVSSQFRPNGWESEPEPIWMEYESSVLGRTSDPTGTQTVLPVGKWMWLETGVKYYATPPALGTAFTAKYLKATSVAASLALNPTADILKFKLRVYNHEDLSTLGSNTFYGSFGISEIQQFGALSGGYNYPRTVLVNLQATASTNTKDLVPTIEFEGRKVAVYNGTTWSFEYSNNPAWVCYDILTQPLMPDGSITPWTTTSPALRYEGLSPTLLDLPSFKLWADFCDEQVSIPASTEKRYTFNGGFDDVFTLWESALTVASMSQAWLIWSGGQIEVALDHTTSVTQLFTSGNYLVDSVKESYISMADRATTIEVNYIDAGLDWKETRFSVLESGYSDSQKKVSLNLAGCTSNTQAYRSAKFALLKNKHVKKSIEFQAPLNAITCQVGDVVELQSNVNKYSMGGRIKGIASSTIIQLDRAYTFSNLKSYGIRIQTVAGTLISANLITLDGTTDTITLTSEITVAALDVYAIGEVSFIVEKLRVTDINATSDLLYTLKGIQYIPEIYDYNDSDIAKIVYSPVADLPVVTGVVLTNSGYYENKLYRAGIHVSVTLPSSVYYKAAKVFYSVVTDDVNITSYFVGFLDGSALSFDVDYPGVSYTVTVATVNTDDITMNLDIAPSAVIALGVPTPSPMTALTFAPKYLSAQAQISIGAEYEASYWELYASTTNNRAGATLRYSGVELNPTIALEPGLIYYFWGKTIDYAASSSSWYPDNATAGVEAYSDALDLALINEFNVSAPNPTSVSQPTFT